MYYKLNEEIYDQVLDQMIDSCGNVYLEIYRDNLVIIFKGEYEYIFDDFSNSLVDVDIYMVCDVYDEHGEYMSSDFEIESFTNYVMENVCI